MLGACPPRQSSGIECQAAVLIHPHPTRLRPTGSDYSLGRVKDLAYKLLRLHQTQLAILQEFLTIPCVPYTDRVMLADRDTLTPGNTFCFAVNIGGLTVILLFVQHADHSGQSGTFKVAT